jgi:hypothetical protein
VGLPLVLFAVLALLVQTLSPNRHVGLLVSLAAGVVWHRGSLGGPDHPLLRYAATVDVPHSALSGFSPASVSFHWFTAYWCAFAVVVALVTLGVWRRGADVPLRTRLRALPRKLGHRPRVAILASALVCAAIGAAVFYQTNVLNAYETGEERLLWKAAYERAYRHLETAPQPHLGHVQTEVALFPEERRYQVKGRYTLENRTGAPLRTLWVTVRRDVAQARLALAGRAPSTTDARFGIHTFVLDPPLAPGATTLLDFDVAVERRGARAEGADHDMLANGSFVLSTTAFPTLGYRRTYEIVDAAERRRQGLPPRAGEDDEAAAAGLSGGDDERITFEATVSTSADQTVIAPGTLEATWEQGGRRFARFSARRRVRPYLAFASARYAIERVRHGGVDVEVYFHPAHATNVRHILDAATRSLDYFSARFGSYPHPALRIAEVPSYSFGAGGLALPGVIYLVEHRAFLTDRRDASRIDIVAKRVAHEVAHQWWGHELVPAEGPGSLVLVESLARYSELLVLKELHGPSSWPPVLEVELDRYLSGRTGGDDVPLARMLGQNYLAYTKGALVMTAMHDLIGEDAVNGVLASLMDDVRADRKPTAKDLVARLREATPENERALVDQWWNEIVLYDLRLQRATVTALPDGRYRVALKIHAEKTRVDDEGHEAPLPMDEMLDLAAYARFPDAAHRGDALYNGRHRITSEGEVELVLDQRPGYVAVDPFVRRIDRNRADNVRKVEEPVR